MISNYFFYTKDSVHAIQVHLITVKNIALINARLSIGNEPLDYKRALTNSAEKEKVYLQNVLALLAESGAAVARRSGY